MSRVLVASFCLSVLPGGPGFGEEGAALYTERCASCHEGGQVARAPSRDVIAALSAERIVSTLETGTMRVQGETLTAEQRRAIARYLSTAAPPATPSAPTTAAAGPRGAARSRADGGGGRAALRRGRVSSDERDRLARLGRAARQRPLSARARLF